MMDGSAFQAVVEQCGKTNIGGTYNDYINWTIQTIEVVDFRRCGIILVGTRTYYINGGVIDRAGRMIQSTFLSGPFSLTSVLL